MFDTTFGMCDTTCRMLVTKFDMFGMFDMMNTVWCGVDARKTGEPCSGDPVDDIDGG